MLCILSVIPLIIVGVMETPDYICGISVGMLLIIIAVGVNLLIRIGMIKGSYDTLLQEGEFTNLTLKIRFLVGLSTDVQEVSALVCGHGRSRQSLQ